MQEKTEWKLYQTSVKAYQAILEQIKSARRSICLEFFIFLRDESGRPIVEALLRKAKEGVEVRIIVDDIGSYPFVRSGALMELQGAGVEVKVFNPVRFWHPNKETFWYFRDHSKLLVIDEEVAFTGGLCIGDEYKNWRDTFAMVKGSHVVNAMTDAFYFMWHRDYKNPEFLFKRSRKKPMHEFDYLMNIPLPGKRHLYYEVVRTLKKAEKEIIITNPYFIPDNKIVRRLKSALKRGVVVKILIPKNSNHSLINLATGSYLDDLLSSGAEIYLYPEMIHGKTIVVDCEWSSIGSLNMDNISLRYNFEGNVVGTNKEFAKDLRVMYKKDEAMSERLTLESWRSRSRLTKFLEKLVWPIRSLL